MPGSELPSATTRLTTNPAKRVSPMPAPTCSANGPEKMSSANRISIMMSRLPATRPTLRLGSSRSGRSSCSHDSCCASSHSLLLLTPCNHRDTAHPTGRTWRVCQHRCSIPPPRLLVKSAPPTPSACPKPPPRLQSHKPVLVPLCLWSGGASFGTKDSGAETEPGRFIVSTFAFSWTLGYNRCTGRKE